MTKKTLDWEFKALNAIDYKIDLSFNVENKMLWYIFQKSRTRIARTKNINISGDVENIQRFDIDKRYHNLLTNIISPIIKKIKKETQEDKIEVLSYYVKYGFFKKKLDIWNVYIEVQGQYVDKR